MPVTANTTTLSARLWAYAVLMLAICFAIAPLVTPPFTGYRDGQLPVPQPDPLIQPPGWAFSIWGVIYLWLIVSAGFGAWKRADHPDWVAMRPPLACALALGTIWLAIALSAPILATLAIAVMTFASLRALVLCGQDTPGLQNLPTGLFAGWLTAATGVSFGVVIPGFGLLAAWPATLLCLLLVLGTALTIQTLRPEVWSYALGVSWALFGICIGALTRGERVIVLLCAIGLAVLLTRAAFALRRRS